MRRERLLGLVLLFVVAAIVPRRVLAYRPFDATDAAVADKGVLEIEFGPAQWVHESAGSSLAAPAVIVNFGVMDHWELVAEAKQIFVFSAAATDQHQIEDAAFSLKGVLRQGTLQGSSGPSLATELSVLVPTDEDEPYVGLAAGLIASQRWSPLTIHWNGFVASTRDRGLGVFTSVIIEGPFAWPVRPVAEAVLDVERSVRRRASALAGLIWRFRQNVAFDAAILEDWADGAVATEVRAGVTWGFQLL